MTDAEWQKLVRKIKNPFFNSLSIKEIFSSPAPSTLFDDEDNSSLYENPRATALLLAARHFKKRIIKLKFEQQAQSEFDDSQFLLLLAAKYDVDIIWIFVS